MAQPAVGGPFGILDVARENVAGGAALDEAEKLAFGGRRFPRLGLQAANVDAPGISKNDGGLIDVGESLVGDPDPRLPSRQFDDR
ncbi:MAG TPA: hypothetical protein DIW61_09825 [Candidatus Aminicenantes bacterium]|nr:hypothetical protein [Candidatus Aminicenantes bacterium]